VHTYFHEPVNIIYRLIYLHIMSRLFLVKHASDILPRLLDGGHTVIAGKLAGAFRNIGKGRIADEVIWPGTGMTRFILEG
jgi:hypothetical protein